MMSCVLLSLVFIIGWECIHACNETAVKNCYADIANSIGLKVNSVQFNNELFLLVHPAAVSGKLGKQEQTCNSLRGTDYTETKECIQNTGCFETKLLSKDVADQPEMPNITWSSITGLLEEICTKDCENLKGRNDEAKKCSVRIADSKDDDPCKTLDEAFICYRKAIGSCDVLVTFTESVLAGSGVIEGAKHQCPNINLSLHSGSTIDRSAVSTMVLALLAILLSST